MCSESRAHQHPFLISFEGLFRRDPTRTRPVGLLVHMFTVAVLQWCVGVLLVHRFTVPVLQRPTLQLFNRPRILLVHSSTVPVIQEAYGIVSPEVYSTRTTGVS